MTKHTPATPLPWQYGELSECVMTKRGRAVTALPEDAIFEADIDQRYIAHAANAYPRLVDMLDELARVESWEERAERVQRRARALLRELGEGS